MRKKREGRKLSGQGPGPSGMPYSMFSHTISLGTGDQYCSSSSVREGAQIQDWTERTPNLCLHLRVTPLSDWYLTPTCCPPTLPSPCSCPATRPCCTAAARSSSWAAPSATTPLTDFLSTILAHGM